MPFKSRKQERYLQINEPEIYRDWVEKYGRFSAESLCIVCNDKPVDKSHPNSMGVTCNTPKCVHYLHSAESFSAEKGIGWITNPASIGKGLPDFWYFDVESDQVNFQTCLTCTKPLDYEVDEDLLWDENFHDDAYGVLCKSCDYKYEYRDVLPPPSDGSSGWLLMGAESFSAEFAAEASYCSNFNDHQWIPFGSEEMSCDKCDAIATPETIKLASEDMFADLDGITRDEKGMRHSPHKKCPDCGAKPTSSWIDPGKCECGRVMNPSEYTNIRFSAELKRDSCCCGATKSKPCACMIQGVMECNATCPCSLEKRAESFGAEENEGELPENMNGCDLCGKSVLKRIKNKSGQVFYYCTNKEPTSFSEDGCMYNVDGSEIRSEGMWLIEDGKSEGYWYNGVVGNINNPDNAYMKSPCPNCDNWHIVSDSCRNCLHCLKCCDCFQCDGCRNIFSEYEDNQSYAWCECENKLCENCRKYDEITDKFYGKCCEGEKWDAESFGADSSETFVFNVADVSGESDDVFTYFIKADNEVEAEEKLHYEVSQDYPDMKFDFMLDGSFGAESFNSYKVAPDLSSYTKAELVSSIAGPQGTAAYQEVVYDPIAQSRMSAETATQRFKDYGNSLAGDSVCPACGSEDWDESFEDEGRGYCGCGHEFSVDSAAANPLLTFYELEALKEQGTLTSDQKEYLEWTITSTLRELDSSSYTKQHIQDELVAHGWTLNRWGNAEPPKESASTLVVNAEGIDSFSPTRLMVLGASIGVALGLYKTRGD